MIHLLVFLAGAIVGGGTFFVVGWRWGREKYLKRWQEAVKLINQPHKEPKIGEVIAVENFNEVRSIGVQGRRKTKVLRRGKGKPDVTVVDGWWSLEDLNKASLNDS